MSQGRRENNRNSKKLINSGVTGVVKRYIDKGAYGFITEDDTYRDVFFHISAVSKSTRRRGEPIRVGDEVRYDLYLAPKGYRAESVHILNQEGSDSDDSYDDNLYRRKDSGIGWSRQREGNKGGAERRRRRRPARRERRDRSRRAESVGRGYRRDEDDYESDDGGWRELSRDRTPRSHSRSDNGSTSRTRGASRGRKQEYQGRQPGFKSTGHDTGFFCQYCQCFHKQCKECTKDDENSSRGETSVTSKAFQRKFTARFPGSEPTNQRSFSYQQTQWVNADAKSDTQSTRTTGKSSPFFDPLKTPNDPRKGENIKKSPSSNRESFQPTGATSQGNSTGTRSTTNTENSDAERKSSDTKSKPQPPPCKSFFDLYGDKASSSKDGKREDSIKKNTFGTGASFPRTGVSSQGSSAGIPNATNTTKSGTERKTPDPKPKSQPPPRNSFFDLFGDRDKASNFNDGKRENSTGASFPQTGVSSQGRSTGIPNATNTTKSGTERKSPDQKPKPQPSPRNYPFSDLLGDKASNSSDAKDDISKNPSKKGSSYPSGIPSEGSGKETQNTTDTTADKSDTKQNSQPGRRSTVYSYSYVNGSNRFTQVPLINNNRSRESSSSAASQQMPANNKNESVPRDGGTARAPGDSKVPTEDQGAKDEIKSTNKGQATYQRPNSQSKEPGGPTVSEENPTTEGPKMKTSTTLSSISREAGNLLFRSARDQRSSSMKSFKLKSALQCYTSACRLSRRDEDLVSAAKNAATTCWRLAEFMQETGDASDKKTIHDYFKEALQYFSKAYLKRNCRGQAWAKHLEKAMQDCFDDIRTWIAPKDENDRIAALTEYLGYLPVCGAKVNGYLYITNICLKRGKEALKFDEYENCQGYLKECRVPLGEAEKICANVDPSIQLCVDGLKRSVEYHEGLVKRYIARVKDVEARQQRERAEESAKKIAMDQLKVDIKTLDLFTKLPVEDFVKQVYRVWPPKGSNGPNPPSSSSSSSSSVASKKKLLIRAISHYHPDKVDKNVHGIKWHLLSCEITKCLNMRLASIK